MKRFKVQGRPDGEFEIVDTARGSTFRPGPYQGIGFAQFVAAVLDGLSETDMGLSPLTPSGAPAPLKCAELVAYGVLEKGYPLEEVTRTAIALFREGAFA